MAFKIPYQSNPKDELNAAFDYSLLQADVSTEAGHKVWPGCLTLLSNGVVCISINGCFKVL